VATWDPSIQTHASSSKWFKSNWIDENEHSHSDHGKFQSPVWLAVVLAVMADRDADRSPQTSSRRESIPGTLHDTPGGISESFSPVSLFLPRSRERRARLEQDNAPSCCPPQRRQVPIRRKSSLSTRVAIGVHCALSRRDLRQFCALSNSLVHSSTNVIE
jgi:hypothetical protein